MTVKEKEKTVKRENKKTVKRKAVCSFISKDGKERKEKGS